ncbi:hypothetical protein GCM10027167_00710 [Nocardia heshunensis]
MCRHLAYLGPPAPVGEILTRGPHSLRTQSWAPREMRGGGTINADGFGVAWWHHPDAATPDGGPGVIWHGGAPPDAHATPETPVTPGDPVVSRYRNAAPIWTDPAVDEVLPQIRSTAVLAAIRSATVGMPIERSACAPFTHGRWAFSHNGAIPDWRRVLTEVAAEFGSPPLLEAESLTDSAALWVIMRGLLDGDGEVLPRSAGRLTNQADPHGAEPRQRAGQQAATAASSGASAEDSSGAGSVPWGRADKRAGAQSIGSAVAFGSTVSITSTSGVPPEVRAWGWAATSEGGEAGFGATGGGVTSAASSTASGTGGSGSVARDSVTGGMEPAEALRRVSAAVLARSPKARLNLLLGDGSGVWGSTWHHSLAVLEGDGFVVVASEPFDDDSRWRPVGDRQLVRVVGGRVAVEPLEIEIGRAGS